jgi:anti-sigma-K factor RskA
MIDEHRQDLAAEYALGSLDPESTRAFESILATDPELRTLADGLRETAATLAYDAPLQLPPPELREKVLARIRGEAQGSAPESAPAAASASAIKPNQIPAPQSRSGNLIPWAIAAGFAITTGAMWMERDQLRKETVELRKDLQAAHQRDEFSKIRIASLTSQVDAYSKATAAIVWDAEKQRGIVKLANIPPAAAGKDYQLWVIDPKYPSPVSGGVVPVGADGIARVAFTPDQPIKKADKFAISVEPAGGVPQATGPIVFLGN